MLDWSIMDLGIAAKISISSVKRAEENGVALVSVSVLDLIRAALEGAGVSFLPDDGSGIGVRLRRRRGASALGEPGAPDTSAA